MGAFPGNFSLDKLIHHSWLAFKIQLEKEKPCCSCSEPWFPTFPRNRAPLPGGRMPEGWMLGGAVAHALVSGTGLCCSSSATTPVCTCPGHGDVPILPTMLKNPAPMRRTNKDLFPPALVHAWHLPRRILMHCLDKMENLSLSQAKSALSDNRRDFREVS